MRARVTGAQAVRVSATARAAAKTILCFIVLWFSRRASPGVAFRPSHSLIIKNMPFVKVATLADVPQNSVFEVSVGEDLYAICNVGGTISALSGVCLHEGGPLGQGNIADGRVVCP